MSRLNAIKEFFQGNFYSALAVALIAVIGTGYLFFYSSVIDPSLRNRDKLISQLGDARKSLVDERKILEQNPADLRSQLANAQATLVASKAMFLTDSQTSQITDVLYKDANASRVTIADLQTQPVTNPSDKSGLSIMSLRLQVQGDSHQLVEFVSRIKEASAKGFVINNLSITQDKTTAKLAMDITLYTLHIASDDSRLTGQLAPTNPLATTSTQLVSAASPQLAPTVVLTPTPIPSLPTSIPPTPTPQSTIHVVRPGDTLFSVARRYGTTVEAIMTANKLSTHEIRVGQQLTIPVR